MKNSDVNKVRSGKPVFGVKSRNPKYRDLPPGVVHISEILPELMAKYRKMVEKGSPR